MTKRVPDKQVVYLHCRSIFGGPRALVRQPRKVRELLRVKKASIKPLIHKFEFNDICTVAKELLDDGVFENESKARSIFPDLFTVSKAQATQREESEKRATKREADAIEEVMLLPENVEATHQAEKIEASLAKDENTDNTRVAKAVEEVVAASRGDKVTGPKGVTTEAVAPSKKIEDTKSVDSPVEAQSKNASKKARTPALDPIYLPFRSQHGILTVTQTLLEGCCFDFASKWLPWLAESSKWESAESVELTTWTTQLVRHEGRIPKTAICEIEGKSLKSVLVAINHLRHSNVHRLRTTAIGILHLLENAVMLAKMLKDSERAGQLEEIRNRLRSSVHGISRNQLLLERKLSDELRMLAKRRATLEARETDAVRDMKISDEENRASAGLLLDNFIAQFQKVPKRPDENLDTIKSGNKGSLLDDAFDASRSSPAVDSDPINGTLPAEQVSTRQGDISTEESHAVDASRSPTNSSRISKKMSSAVDFRQPHGVMLRIVYGSERHQVAVLLPKRPTRQSLLDHAQAYLERSLRALGHSPDPKAWMLEMESVTVHDFKFDLPTYGIRDLWPILRAFSQTATPQFTVRVSHVDE